MAETVEYRVEQNSPSATATEETLNKLSKEGWRVIGFSQYQILLERKINEKQGVEQICG